MKQKKTYDTMQQALKQAFAVSTEKAIKGVKRNTGGPFGAAIIQCFDNKYTILVVAPNTVLYSKDPTAHAEINCIRKACRLLDRFHLEDCVLVTTAKSCPMCLSAACWAKIPIVYYGVDYKQATESGFQDDAILQYLRDGKNHLIQEIDAKQQDCIVPFEVWKEKIDKKNY